MAERKTEFWWASIHGAEPEPVEKTEHAGRACVYTLGCADPFYLDEEGVVEFVAPEPGDVSFGVYRPPVVRAMTRPSLPDKDVASVRAKEATRRRYNAAHGWRGPR